MSHRYQINSHPPVGMDDLPGALVALSMMTQDGFCLRVTDQKDTSNAWIGINGMVLPKGALLTHITPQRHCDPMESSVPDVEVQSYNSYKAPVLDVGITVEILNRLESQGVVRLDSSSGRDPNLYYRYDHYVVD